MHTTIAKPEGKLDEGFHSRTTLYKRIGDQVAIRAAVGRFYERVLDDPSLSYFFNVVSKPRLKAYQLAILSQALADRSNLAAHP